jgi:flagellum-specific peptidoglycan hydrolase FlgJ
MASVSSAQQKSFIGQIAPIIQAEAKKRGYSICSAAIAQACWESGYGTSDLSWKYHNYHGLKCGKYWKGPSVNMRTCEEYTPGTLTVIKDYFRVFPDMASGVAGYYDFISTNRYKAVKTAVSAQDYLEKLKAANYCTSTTYVSKCMGVVTRHKLTDWDKELKAPASGVNNYPVPKRLLKRGVQGDDVLWLQAELNKRGYNISPMHPNFGPQTDAAVRDFQSKHHLVVDGIVGPKTLVELIDG